MNPVGTIFLASSLLSAPVAVHAGMDSKPSETGIAVDCSEAARVLGTFYVGEKGYFERQGCEQRYSLKFEREVDRSVFSKMWVELHDSRGGDILLEIKGAPSGRTGRFGLQIYHVEEILSISKKNFED